MFIKRRSALVGIGLLNQCFAFFAFFLLNCVSFGVGYQWLFQKLLNKFLWKIHFWINILKMLHQFLHWLWLILLLSINDCFESKYFMKLFNQFLNQYIENVSLILLVNWVNIEVEYQYLIFHKAFQWIFVEIMFLNQYMLHKFFWWMD